MNITLKRARHIAFTLLLGISTSGWISAGAKAADTEPARSWNAYTNTTKGKHATSSNSQPASSKAIAWELGNKLSVAALLYDLNGTPNSDSFMKAKALAATVDAQVPPFPAKTGDKAKDTAAILYYLLNEAGKPIIKKINEKHGVDHGQLFEMSLKANLLLTLYGPGEKDALAISGVIKRNATRLNLPANLWQPLVDKVEAGAPFAEVKDAVFKMQQSVGRYLATQS